ncbi:MAG TPA: hypothetical protein V6C84_02290 [Coleofasciculaceae cyanobacterium]
MDDLPLLELFTRLREAGMPLGIKDYELALQALQGGYGLPVRGATPAESRAALARLCRTLWVRSPDEQQLLDVYFEQLLGCEVTPEFVAQPKRWRFNGALTGFISLVIIGAGTALWFTHENLFNQKKSDSQPTLSPQILSPEPTAQSSSNGSPQVVEQGTGSTTKPTQALSPQPPLSETPLIWIVWSLPIVVGLGLGIWGMWWFVRSWLKQRTNQSSKFKPDLNLSSKLLRDAEDEIQLAHAVYQLSSKEERPRDRFVLSIDYLPVTQRQMKQSWRYLRRMVREGLATELDIEATVRQIARDGVLLEPMLTPPRVNRTELLLLIDQDGSMVPFHSLSVRLAETTQRGGQLGQAGIYYFHNCPVDYLYHDFWHQQAELVPNILTQLRRDRTVVLIFSDAGAARGGLNFKRVSLTTAFLRRLKRHVRYVAWLNPMPKNRWTGTTAGEIARYVPMFEGTRQGLDQAIDALRGRYLLISQPHEVTQLYGDEQ